jgi:hypothetical protein
VTKISGGNRAQWHRLDHRWADATGVQQAWAVSQDGTLSFTVLPPPRGWPLGFAVAVIWGGRVIRQSSLKHIDHRLARPQSFTE